MFKRHYISALPLIYSMLFCLFSCTPPIPTTPPLTESELKYNEVIEEFKQIELIDTVNKDLKTCAISEISTAYYLPLYIGLLPKRIDLSDRESIDLEIFSERDDHTIRVNPTDFIIYVDTSRIIGMQNRQQVLPPPPPPGSKIIVPESVKKFKRLHYKSYPVFIKNSSDSFVFPIGYDQVSDLIIEAKDSFGIWRPIQKQFFTLNCLASPPLSIPPKNVLLTACPIFNGEYKTKLRIVLGVAIIDENNEKITPFVSNVFEGYINYGQFEHSDPTYKRRNIYCE